MATYVHIFPNMHSIKFSRQRNWQILFLIFEESRGFSITALRILLIFIKMQSISNFYVLSLEIFQILRNLVGLCVVNGVLRYLICMFQKRKYR